MTNREKLNQYKATYGLTSQRVANLLDVSLKTVSCWLLSTASTNYRPMPNREIKFLHCLLKHRKKRG